MLARVSRIGATLLIGNKADLVSEAGSNAPSAATTGAAGRAPKKRGRRPSNKLAYGQPPQDALVDAESLVRAEALDKKTCEAQGYEWCGNSYWVPPKRLGWCVVCGVLDDWKVMQPDYVKELSKAEAARYAAAKERNPRYPELRYGKQRELKVYTCSQSLRAHRLTFSAE